MPHRVEEQTLTYVSSTSKPSESFIGAKLVACANNPLRWPLAGRSSASVGSMLAKKPKHPRARSASPSDEGQRRTEVTLSINACCRLQAVLTRVAAKEAFV